MFCTMNGTSQVNNPEYEEILLNLKAELQNNLDDLPGKFDL